MNTRHFLHKTAKNQRKNEEKMKFIQKPIAK